ncbi:MAG TPA: PQQ-dependent sugar dehydrogenase [bacterium]|nr:PQQ-dependent sugar dehydrogenase [bacterium]
MIRRILALHLLLLLLGPRSSFAYSLPTGFFLEPVVGGPFVGAPVAFTFLPDGRILLTEQYTGNVRLSTVGSGTSTLLFTVPDVNGTAGTERGLLGIVVDPAWPARPYVYFYYSHTGNVSYLTMYTVSGSLTDPSSANLTFGSPYFLLTDIPDVTTFHNGGTLRFGKDGMLLLSVGDDGASCAAQNENVPAGKILRLNIAAMPGGGSGPPPKSALVAPDHPLDSGDNARLVGAWGVRNPFRFTVDALTGNAVIGDVGLDTQEEIDLLLPKALGPNYGWPQLEGTINPMCCGPCGIGNIFTAPIYTYNHTGTQAIIAGPILRAPASGPPGFPSEYWGDIFLTDYYGAWIRRLKESAGTWSIAPQVAGQPSATDWAIQLPWISDFQLGPDGFAYILQQFGGTQGVNRIGQDVVLDAGQVAAIEKPFLSVFPSPARIGETIQFQWPVHASGKVKLTIRDVAGRVVRVLPATANSDALPRAEWDGRAANGRPVAAGTYFAKLESERGTIETAKIVLLR